MQALVGEGIAASSSAIYRKNESTVHRKWSIPLARTSSQVLPELMQSLMNQQSEDLNIAICAYRLSP
jgi:tRNA A37 threonylcarbamoyladenosine modification protein TsaB